MRLGRPDDAERTLLARLAAFPAGCTLDAIDEVLRTSWDPLEDPFDLLQRLREESVVVVDEPPRYRLPEALRASVLESTPDSEREVAQAGLFQWADGFCARFAAGSTGVDQEAWFDRAELESENLRAAIDYGRSRPALRATSLRMAVDLRRFWAVRGHYVLGRTLTEPILDVADDLPDELRATATNLVGVLALSMGDLDAAERRLTESLALARRIGDAMAQGRVLGNLGMIAWERTDHPAAQRAFGEAAEIFRGAGEWASLGTALLNLGSVLIDMDDLEAAQATLRESLESLRRGGNQSGLAFAAGNLGYLALLRREPVEALAHIRASLDAFGRLGEWKGTLNTLISATALLAAPDPESAATIRGAIEAMAQTEGIRSTPREARRLADIDRELASTPGAASLPDSRAKGFAMSPRHAIEYTLSALSALASGVSPESSDRN